MARSQRLPVVLMRGGTSKGVFVGDAALPAAGPERDAFLLALMGSPDPMQIDGLGGTMSSTSKIVAVSRSQRPDCDIDYTFYQVGIDRPIVDARGNCGNLTAAVGPYAIDEGLVTVADGLAEVRLFNLNTERRIIAHVPVEGGMFAWAGDYSLDGVPGTGAPILTEYLEPAGAATGRLFPTGRPIDVLRPRVGDPVTASIVDVTGPVVLVTSEQVGVPVGTDPAKINSNPALLERLESIRGAAAVAAGLAGAEADALANSPALPRVAVVDRAMAHTLVTGRQLGADDHDLVVRSTSLQRAHHAIPLTTAMCVAAASALPGTVAHELAATGSGTVRLAHPKGVTDVSVRLGPATDAEPTVLAVGVLRTARRLLDGIAHVDPRG